MDNRPIGIFDSGSGGLTIWKSITTLLPYESTIYIGDHAHTPYGEKTKEFIRERVICSLRFLLSKNVKVIVIACNAATVSGIDYFRKQFPDVPIVGVVPVVKTAAEKTKTGRFAVLSTVYTAKSQYQKKIISTFAPHCHVFSVGNTELVRLIEEGKKDSPEVTLLLENVLRPVLAKNIDIVALGCTHFPFLRLLIEKIVGKSVMVLDSGHAVARQVKHILEHEGMFSLQTTPGYHFFTTGDPTNVTNVASQLLGSPIVVEQAQIPYNSTHG